MINVITFLRRWLISSKKKKENSVIWDTGQNTYQEWKEEMGEGVVPKIVFLLSQQLVWLIPLSSHMQVTSYGCRHCPVCPLTWSPAESVNWRVQVCLVSTCSSPWSSCCRWRTLTVCESIQKCWECVFIHLKINKVLPSHPVHSGFSHYHLLPSPITSFSVSFPSIPHLVSLLLCRSWFPSPFTFPLS